MERGRPGPGLLAHVLVSKYCDGLPLYRLSGILAREGVEIERQTLADWVGRGAWWLRLLAEAIGKHALVQRVIWTDDTPIRVLAPGRGKTREARFWGYAHDPRPWGGTGPPVAFYCYSTDRKGERRLRDGVWHGPNGPQCTKLSAVLVARGLSPWTLGQRDAVFIENA